MSHSVSCRNKHITLFLSARSHLAHAPYSYVSFYTRAVTMETELCRSETHLRFPAILFIRTLFHQTVGHVILNSSKALITLVNMLILILYSFFQFVVSRNTYLSYQQQMTQDVH